MLEDSLFESQGRGKTRKPLTVAIAIAAHVVTIGTLVLIPLLQTQALTLPPVNLSLLAPRLKTTNDLGVFSAHNSAPRSHVTPASDALTAPPSIPPRIVITDDGPAPAIPGLSLGNGGPGKSLVDLFSPGDGAIPPPVPPAEVARPVLPPPPEINNRKPIPIGGNVQAAKLIHQVKPVYPRLAQQTRVQGVVVLEAIIAKDGSVKSLRVASGHPFLSRAALDAVQQWLYSPTTLNGEPVEVSTAITVTFTLQ
jgi:TonB family protein